VANYLQRVIASGALTSAPQKAPVSVSPVVPVALAAAPPPIAMPDPMGHSVDKPSPSKEPGSDLASVQPQISAEAAPKVDAPAKPPGAAAETLLPADVAPPQMPAKPLEPARTLEQARPAPPNPRPETYGAPRAAVLPPAMPTLRIHAPKGIRQAQSRWTEPSSRPASHEPVHTPSVELPGAPTLEPAPQTTAAMPEASISGRSRESDGPKISASSRTAAVRADTRHELISADPPAKPDTRREPVPAVSPAPAQGTLQPLPPREPQSGPIAPVPRATRRITIGRVDVQVNNRPAVPPQHAPAAPAPAASSFPAFELDRFAIKP
jgi:hypothetical protein